MPLGLISARTTAKSARPDCARGAHRKPGLLLLLLLLLMLLLLLLLHLLHLLHQRRNLCNACCSVGIKSYHTGRFPPFARFVTE